MLHSRQLPLQSESDRDGDERLPRQRHKEVMGWLMLMRHRLMATQLTNVMASTKDMNRRLINQKEARECCFIHAVLVVGASDVC
jgi:hypothetical protein